MPWDYSIKNIAVSAVQKSAFSAIESWMTAIYVKTVPPNFHPGSPTGGTAQWSSSAAARDLQSLRRKNSS